MQDFQSNVGKLTWPCPGLHWLMNELYPPVIEFCSVSLSSESCGSKWYLCVFMGTLTSMFSAVCFMIFQRKSSTSKLQRWHFMIGLHSFAIVIALDQILNHIFSKLVCDICVTLASVLVPEEFPCIRHGNLIQIKIYPIFMLCPFVYVVLVYTSVAGTFSVLKRTVQIVWMLATEFYLLAF